MIDLPEIGPPLAEWRRPCNQRGVLARLWRRNYVGIHAHGRAYDLLDALTTASVGPPRPPAPGRTRRDRALLFGLRWVAVRREVLPLLAAALTPADYPIKLRELSTLELAEKYEREVRMEHTRGEPEKEPIALTDEQVAGLAESLEITRGLGGEHHQQAYRLTTTVDRLEPDGVTPQKRTNVMINGSTRHAPTGVAHDVDAIEHDDSPLLEGDADEQ